MSILQHFPDLTVEDAVFSFTHLSPFTVNLTGQARDGGDLQVRVSFQSHVFSRAVDEGDQEDFADINGKGRCFCETRYNSSIGLPDLCRQMLASNILTWDSKDRNSVSNLAVVGKRLVSGQNYAIYYYLFPSRLEGCDVEMVIKSAYVKDIDFEKIKRRYKTHQKIKECYYQNKTVP